MFRENKEFLKKVSVFIDATIVALCFLAAYYVREWIGKNFSGDLFPKIKLFKEGSATLDRYFPLLVISVLLWIVGLYLNGMYGGIRTKSLAKISAIVMRASFYFLVGFGALIFVFDMKFVGRLIILLFMIFTFLAIIVEKYLLISGLEYLRKKGFYQRRVVVVGTGRRAAAIIQNLKGHPEWGLRILGVIDDEPGRGILAVAGVEVIGTLDFIGDILKKEAVDEVIVVVPRSRLSHIEKAVRFCETVGVQVSIAMDLFNLEIARSHHTDLDGVPFVSIYTTVLNVRHLLAKRFMDVVLSFLGIILSLPIFLVATLAVKITSKGPVIFKQKRIGLNSREFVLFKFRTMYSGAELLRAEMESKNELDGPAFKMKRDPRVTPVGRILRKLSIDELPQLFNILAGQMSLVGPRALPTYEIEKIDLWQRRRLSMRPGLTGLWQVKGRNKIDFNNWMKLDLEYLDNWSLWLDIKILARTIPAVLFGRGAY
jgi:exopolysaccharide biosynthesis polyprenyl glycosylphosphotransferase